jgi:hypothetical protein
LLDARGSRGLAVLGDANRVRGVVEGVRTDGVRGQVGVLAGALSLGLLSDDSNAGAGNHDLR